MTLTIEQRAISEYLERNISYSEGGCCCLGAREIKNFKLEKEPYVVKILNESDRKKYIVFVKKHFNISIEEAKNKVDNNNVGFENPYICEDFFIAVKEKNMNVEIIFNPTGLEPLCCCAMQRVIEIDQNYYEVKENRSDDGVKYEVIFLGKVGGPYKSDVQFFKVMV